MTKQLKLALPLAAFACLAWAAHSVDYDHNVDFSKYHTYSWIGVKAGDSLWQDRITSAVNQQLAAKGWTMVPNGGDASVSAFGRVSQHDTLETFYDGFPGWGWRGWGGMGMATTETVPEQVGNLTVDIFDSGTKHLIWRGRASEAVTGKPEKNEKKMDKAVAEMFDKFPPKGKS